MISVIIPSYNEAAYIGATLRALEAQDYKKRFEIIVVDSKSKDGTAKIARRYADRVLSVEYRGPSHARNRGAEIARGEIIAFLDADSIPVPNWLREIEKTMRKKSVVAATTWIVPLSPHLVDFLIYATFNNLVRATLKLRRSPLVGFAGTAFIVRKDVFWRTGGFNERIFVTEDLELAGRLRKFGRLTYMRDTMVLTSPRRLRGWGRYKAMRAYFTNFLRVKSRLPTWPLKKFAAVR